MRVAFRTRLIASYSLVLAGLLAAASVLLVYTMREMAQSRLDATLWVLGTTEAEGIVGRLRDRNLREPDELAIFDVDHPESSADGEFRSLYGSAGQGTPKYVNVINANGQVADFSLNLPNGPMPMNPRLIELALEGQVHYDTIDMPEIGRLRIIYVPAPSRWTERFLVMVGVPTASMAAEVGSVARRVAVISLFILGLAVSSGWLLARRALRPIVDAAVALQGFSDRTLHRRLPDSGVEDEISHLVRMINELLARLDRAFAAQQRFTADASHEICTPLTVLKGNTQVALLARRTPEEYEAILKSNLEEIDRLTSLATDLLTLARSDAGEQQASQASVFLNDLVEDVCARLASAAARSAVNLSWRASQPAIVNGDSIALQQILLNLVTNAIRYTPRGGGVDIGVGHRPDGMACVEVADTGIGIPAEALSRIFDRFYRGENARAHCPAGSGLGLAICQVLAKAHDGRIEVTSEPGKGSVFTLLLPAPVPERQTVEAGV